MVLQIDRATVRKAVIEYVVKNLLGDAKKYDIDSSKVVISKSGLVEVSINMKEEGPGLFDLEDIDVSKNEEDGRNV